MYDTTMAGSFYRPKEIEDLLKVSGTGEVSEKDEKPIKSAETLAVSDQIHPLGSKVGLSWVSNGDQRKSGYTTYIPNRFSGFSSGEKKSHSSSQKNFMMNS
ncbi:hypothetical protein OXIME_000744 [Oxyplasma meridianum]|uniref:Uncharacterized protein n=1 Tax=Oxyplasma meridianum TaxID=3073602 RepID=A0AAX4NHA5_9ARCH